MPAMNDITGDRLVSSGLSPQGEVNFDNIFGKRDYRNRPILQEPIPDGDGITQRALPRHSTGCPCGGAPSRYCWCESN